MQLRCYQLSEGTLPLSSGILPNIGRNNLPDIFCASSKFWKETIYLISSGTVPPFGRIIFLLPSRTVPTMEGKIYPNIFWKRSFERNITLLSSGTVPTLGGNITLLSFGTVTTFGSNITLLSSGTVPISSRNIILLPSGTVPKGILPYLLGEYQSLGTTLPCSLLTQYQLSEGILSYLLEEYQRLETRLPCPLLT